MKILSLSRDRNIVSTEVGIMEEGMVQMENSVWVVGKEFGPSIHLMCFQ